MGVRINVFFNIGNDMILVIPASFLEQVVHAFSVSVQPVYDLRDRVHAVQRKVRIGSIAEVFIQHIFTVGKYGYRQI